MDVHDEKINVINVENESGDITMSTNCNNDLRRMFVEKNEQYTGNNMKEIKTDEKMCPIAVHKDEPIECIEQTSKQVSLDKQLNIDNANIKVDETRESSSNTGCMTIISEKHPMENLQVLTAKDVPNDKQCESTKDTKIDTKFMHTNGNEGTNVKVCSETSSDTASSKNGSLNKSKIKKAAPKKAIRSSNALSQLLDYGMSDSEDSASDSVSLSESSDTDSVLSDEIGVIKPSTEDDSSVRNHNGFRENDSSSDNSTTDYESDSSSDSSEIVGACAITPVANTKKPVHKMSATLTRGEMALDDLPPIQELQISVPEQECVEVGIVTSIVEQLVIVQSLPGSPAYDIDTLLFLERGIRPLGLIFDVLGPVTEPFYAVRFNSYEQAVETGVKPGTPVYCAPHNSQHTAYVFVSELLKMKGSDASWRHNNEPPEIFLDYSDDEQEQQARRLRRPGKSQLSDNPNSNSLERNKKFERQMNDKNMLMNERYNQPSTSRKQHAEPEKKSFQHMPHTPSPWTVPNVPRPMPRPEFCLPPYQYGYFNQYGSFPMMPQFGVANPRQPCMPPMMGPPGVFHAPQPFNPNIPPPIMRPQPVPYFPNPRHPRWVPPTNGVLQPPRGNFGNGSFTQ